MAYKGNINNLKPYPKGVSGNPKGNALDRHSTRTISEWINKLLNDDKFTATIREGLELREYKGAPIEAIIQAQIHLAINGDVKAADLLFKHGQAQKIQLGNDPENPITTPVDENVLSQFMMTLKNSTKQ